MTPKIKAFDFIESFKNVKVPLRKGSTLYLYMSKDMAVECALLVVKKIEDSLTEYGRDSDQLQNMDSEFRYWDNVKNELENEKENTRR